MPDIEDMYPLTAPQQGMLFHTISATSSGIYVEQVVWRLTGPLDTGLLANAWQLLVDRNTVLRTSFLWQEVDEPLQIVHQRVQTDLPVWDWRGDSADDRRRLLAELLDADRDTAFDLATAPLVRPAVIRVGVEHHWLVWSCHHAILDGWSVAELRRELLTLHNELRSGREVPPGLRRPFRDFVAWLGRRDPAPGRQFWRRQMEGFATPLRLTDGFAPDAAGGYGSVHLSLSSEDTTALREFCRTRRLTPNTVIQGAWALLLHRYTGESDVVFGVTSSGRPADFDTVESMTGPFITTTPLRITVDDSQVQPWLQALQVGQADARLHEHTPLPDIHGFTHVARGVPLFETVMAFENHLTDATTGERIGDVEVATEESTGRTNYPITVIVTASARLTIRLTFDRTRFDKDWMGRLTGHLQMLLLSIVRDGERSLAALPMLRADELAELANWNSTDRPRPSVRLESLFLAEAALRPTATALISADRQLTYGELDQRSAALAATLIGAGSHPDRLVAVVMKRGWEQVVAVLGILRAGAAYLPIDPQWPRSRIHHLLDRGECDLVVTQPAVDQALPWPEGVTRFVIDQSPVEIPQPDRPAPGRPDDLAYVIFTSGSTGEPKGVAIDHRAVVNTVLDINERFAIGADDRLLALSSLGFDLSVYDIFGALAAGATLVIPEASASQDPARWAAWVDRAEVTVWNSVPAMLELLTDHAERTSSSLASLRIALLSGDWIPVSLPDRFRAAVPDAVVVSLGGATEASIWSISHPIDEVDPTWDSIPYGRPLDNQRFHILGPGLQPVPAGVPGELCIGGAGLARGYWRDDVRTAASFTRHPISGERIYRTGDLGRYDANGEIRFLGRRDDQVKIHGFRVEPGEVEAHLLTHPAVTNAAVVVRGGRERRLAAYVVAPENAPTVGELRDYLADRLPRYLIPAVFVVVPELPLTANSKIDRAALPELSSARPNMSAPFTLPSSEIEELLVKAWCDALGLDSVGVEDNFFELGGDSLTTMRLAAQLHRRDIEVTIGAIFEHPTIRELAAIIGAAGGTANLPPVRREPQDGPIPLTYAQEMIQILNALTPGSTAYVPRTSIEFQGPLDVVALGRALDALAARHTAFRTRFESKDEWQLQQHVNPAISVLVQEHDLRLLAPEQAQRELTHILIHEVAAAFDPIADEPLHRIALVWLADDRRVLHLAMDHLVCDGWSLMILMRDLLTLYRAETLAIASDLPDLPVDYPDYAIWQRRHLVGERLERTVEFWRSRMAGVPAMQLPSNRPPVPMTEMRGKVLKVYFEPDIIDGAAALARRERTTIFTVLMAAVQTVAWAQLQEDVITVSAPVGGRTRPELENLVGCFVHGMMFPTNMSGEPSFAEVVRRVRDGVREAWDHQNLPLSEMAKIAEFATVNNMGTQGIALEWVDDQTGVVDLPGVGGTVRAVPWWPHREGDVDMPPADLFVFLHRSPHDGGLAGEFMYNSARFDVPEIAAVFEQLRETLRRGTSDPSRRLADLTKSQ